MTLILVVFDTNVLIKVYLHRYVLGDRFPYTEIHEAIFDEGLIVPIYSRPTMNELLWKLTIPNELTKKFQIDPAHAKEFIEALFYGLGDIATNVHGANGKSTDPKDWIFEETAIAGGVEAGRPSFLVSDDADLHETDVIENLRKFGIEVLWSRDFGPKLCRPEDDP